MIEILIAFMTGLVSSVATVVSLKTDMGWIKNILKQHESRIKTLERKI